LGVCGGGRGAKSFPSQGWSSLANASAAFEFTNVAYAKSEPGTATRFARPPFDPPPCESVTCPPAVEWNQPSPKPDPGPLGASMVRVAIERADFSEMTRVPFNATP